MTIISAVAGSCTVTGSGAAAAAGSGVLARLASVDLAASVGIGVVALSLSSVAVLSASSFLFGLHSVRVTIPSARFSNEAALNCKFFSVIFLCVI